MKILTRPDLCSALLSSEQMRWPLDYASQQQPPVRWSGDEAPITLKKRSFSPARA